MKLYGYWKAYRWHIQLRHCSLDNHELYYTAWCRGYRIHPHTGTHQVDMSAGLGVHKSQPHIHENWLTSYINITVKMWPFDLTIKQLEGHKRHFKVKCTFSQHSSLHSSLRYIPTKTKTTFHFYSVAASVMLSIWVFLVLSSLHGVHSNPTVISHTQLSPAKKKPRWKWKRGRYLFTVPENATYTNLLSKLVTKYVWEFVSAFCDNTGQVYLTHSSC